MSDSKSKVLVITGGSKGIGYATALRFRADGYRIVNLSRSPIDLPDALQIGVDLAAPDWARSAGPALLDAIADAGSVALVHNSALQIPGNVAGVEEGDVRAMLEVNVVAPLLLNRLLLSKLPRGSSVLYLGSTLSLRATAQMAVYTTSKHALLGLMRSTCQDLAGTGIHTALICPGFTETEMLRGFGGEMLERLAALSTQRRLIQPAEIAEVIHFAATHPVVNGATLGADTGLVEH